MFRVMRESENVDERQHCFLAQSPGKPPRYLSVETRQELLRVEAAWHTAVCSAVTYLKVCFLFIFLFFLKVAFPFSKIFHFWLA